MSFIGTILKIGITAGAVMIGQRLWDRYQVQDLWVRLDQLVLSTRNQTARLGTVRAHVKVDSVTLVEEFKARILFVDSLKELERNIEIYIESIPD